MIATTLPVPPFATTLKPYGTALLELARRDERILCLGADLTRQTETDLFREELPDRFINGGMAEQNLMGVAAGLARSGHQVWVHTFGVFATRRPFDQVALAIAYPRLNVRLVGFMPGVSSPGGPSHQAIEDVALMRALPGMTVIDVADAVEVRQAVFALAEHDGPAYLRLKRGEVPIIYDEATHRFRIGEAQMLDRGDDVALIASGMMVPTAIEAAHLLRNVAGIHATVVNVPTIKPLDTGTLVDAVRDVRAVLTMENHTIVGGLGSAVAEALLETGLTRPFHRLGIRDVFAEGAARAPHLFARYGLSVQHAVACVARLLHLDADRAAALAEASATTRRQDADGYSPV